jgi:hypothetical protein
VHGVVVETEHLVHVIEESAILILICNGFGVPAASYGCYDARRSPHPEAEGL